MKCEDLKELCKKWNIRQGNIELFIINFEDAKKKKKADLVQVILNRVANAHSARSQLESTIQTTKTKWNIEAAMIHQSYRSFFNLVDLLDKYFYKVQDHHCNIRWKGRFCFFLLRFPTVNVWAFTIWHTPCRYRIFRRDFAAGILEKLI